MKKNLLHYELYGSSTGAGNKGSWRWAIFAGHEKKPLLVGSFSGTFESAKEHAAANIASERTHAETQTASLKVVGHKLSTRAA